MHNVPALMRGKDRCTLLIHPDDASRAGIRTGDVAEVATGEGSLTVPAEISEEMMPGVVSLPHGWGHGLDGTRLNVAERPSRRQLATCSIPPHLIDVPSGTQVVNGVPCRIRESTLRRSSMAAPNLPPGFDFTDPDIYAQRLPVEEFAEVRRAAPIWWNEQPPDVGGFGDGGFWVVSKHRDVRDVSLRSDVFSSAARTVVPRFNR